MTFAGLPGQSRVSRHLTVGPGASWATTTGVDTPATVSVPTAVPAATWLPDGTCSCVWTAYFWPGAATTLTVRWVTSGTSLRHGACSWPTTVPAVTRVTLLTTFGVASARRRPRLSAGWISAPVFFACWPSTTP